MYVYFEDKSKAFDKVPHSILRLALRRIRLPEPFIQLRLFPGTKHRPPVKLKNLSFVDDAAFFACTPGGLHRTVARVDSFNAACGIRSNAAKGAVLSINSKREPLIKSNDVEVPRISSDGAFRYLGVFLNATGTGGPAVEAMEETFGRAMLSLRNKKITAKMAVYVINAVVWPAMVYRSRNFVPKLRRLQKWDASARALIRKKLHVASTFHASALHHPAILALASIEEQVTRYHMKAWQPRVPAA
ncbi:hypothetical protein H9P43_010168 [Blastocladiella emersonii ATCC 22665]|nr:hypothetical protein H9P43_010168 [Blastocladiella emersonii ATCC 22665]